MQDANCFKQHKTKHAKPPIFLEERVIFDCGECQKHIHWNLSIRSLTTSCVLKNLDALLNEIAELPNLDCHLGWQSLRHWMWIQNYWYIYLQPFLFFFSSHFILMGFFFFFALFSLILRCHIHFWRESILFVSSGHYLQESVSFQHSHHGLHKTMC